jgi:hypothetical protein
LPTEALCDGGKRLRREELAGGECVRVGGGRTGVEYLALSADD